MLKSSAFLLFKCIAAMSFILGSNFAHSALIPAESVNLLTAGQPVDLIIEYQASFIEQDANLIRKQKNLRVDDDYILAYKSSRYKILKDDANLATANPDIERLTDYSHLPLSFKRFHSLASLNALSLRPEIRAIYPNAALHSVLTQSLPLINQPAVASAGERGLGNTVVVIDNGIDYTNAAFGSCTAPGIPASCRVPVSLNFGTGTTDNSHGTNVSAVVLGVAPDSRIAMLNAFSGTSAFTADIISAINWSILNKSTYNIVAINMSLGDGTNNTSPCSAGNAFATPVTSAINAGIAVVAASGNDGFTNGLNKPACTPGIISVGAVYDSSIGGVTWGTLCTDTTTTADKITCFSDSANFLTLLAPGALITAAGITNGGTSQASPHVAGAIAVLRSTFPSESLAQIQTRLTSSGKMITDARNGKTKPRLNLLEAARPANDAFANRVAVSGNNGTLNYLNLLGTKESGEPPHAGNAGGHSVWWKYTPAVAGQLSVDTLGSTFSTLLAAYTGNSVSALTSVASGNGSILLQVQANQEYEIAVDGANSASGNITLNWKLNTAATANLGIDISGVATGTTGLTSPYTVLLNNAGPQAATHVVTNITLPANSSLASAPAECFATGNTVTCNSGTLASGAQASFPLQITWNSAASAAISATVTSDLPDPMMTNNSAAIQVTVGATNDNTNNNVDVPTLPQWAMLLLAMLLIRTAVRARP